MRFVLAPVGGVTGTATLSIDSFSPELDGCTLGSMGASVVCGWSGGTNNDSATVTLTLATSSDASGTWRVTTAWANNQGGPHVIAAEDVTVTLPPPSADLTITKSGSPNPVLPGETLSYTLDYANDGPDDASGVTVSDTLPSGVAFVSATAPCVESAGMVTCNIGTLAASASGQILIVVSVDSAVAPGTTLTNNASISSVSPTDPDLSNNGASVTTTVPEIADLAIVKGDDVDPVLPGDNLIYSVDYINNGPSIATTVEIIDVLPADVSFVSASAGCSEGSGVVTCDIGTVAPGASGQVVIEVVVSPSAIPGSTIINDAAISMDPAIQDLVPGNNSASETTTIQAVADMSIGKSDDFDPVVAGTRLTYTIDYDNLGVSDATGVEVVDTLPGGVTFVSATPDQGTCSQAGGVIDCDLGDVAAASAPGQILVVVDVPANTAPGTSLTNTAGISSDIIDQVPSNDTTTETTQVVAEADMSISKEDVVDPVMAGDPIVYTLTYQNLGPSDATGAQVIDTLPAGVSFVSATPDQGTCIEASGSVSCNVGAMSAGDSGQISIVVDVPTDASEGTLSNTATISSDIVDPEPSNDSATESTTVGASADLSVTKVGTPDPVSPGDNLIYTVSVSNAGPSTAVDVVVTDTLPAGVGFVSATPDAGICSEAGGVVTCMVGDLAPGSGGSVLLVVSIPSSAPPGSITNDVGVTSATFDPSLEDNAAVSVVAIAAQGTTTTTSPTTSTTAPTSTSTSTGTTDTTVSIDDLPFTGLDGRLLAAIASSLLLSGLLVVGRRRPDSD